MTVLITGGSKCGKSALAERLFEGFAGEKCYIATMQPYGEEAHAAIERHHKMRAGKGFCTMECYTGLEKLSLPDGCGVLLECMGNLCANEMFRPDGIKDPESPILRGIRKLQAQSELLVIVTNEVGSDGVTYTPETMQYIRHLSCINRETAALADTVIECVAGIPLVLKGETPCCIR